jgi:dihydrofolate synthase/folylpolyglutamate synthase
MLRDKDASGVAQVLEGRIAAWYCAGLDGPRGQTGEALAAKVRPVVSDEPVYAHSTVAQALDAALEDATEEDIVLVFGSFLTAGEAIRHFGRA